jgi:hypothetical protein
MKVELTPDAAQWVQAEIAAGTVRHAIQEAKRATLRAALDAAEAEGGNFSTDDVHRHAHEHLDKLGPL